jgi:hypothetical protein
MSSLGSAGEADDSAFHKQTGCGVIPFGSLEKYQLHDRLHRLVLVIEKITGFGLWQPPSFSVSTAFRPDVYRPPMYFMKFSMSLGTITAFSVKTSLDVWAMPEQHPRPALYPACLTAAAALAL